jgi:hypothetical protein
MASAGEQDLLPGVLSVDLASRRYADFGFAFLPPGRITVRFPAAADLGLRGRPLPGPLAEALDAFCREQEVGVLLLDGPQGWKSPRTGIRSMRLCERVLNTPAKTGPIGHIKPATYLRYVALSIALFHVLRTQHGWSLLRADWMQQTGRRWLVESFPSKSWETLGLKRLPAKASASPELIERWRRALARRTGLRLPKGLTHDQLQAAVVLPAGRALASRQPGGLVMVGMDPRITRKGDVLEGWIALPALQP